MTINGKDKKKKKWQAGSFTKTTLISKRSTCLGFASPSINDVATDDPG